MSRNFVLLLATIFISAVIFCAAVSAQTSVTYHIWNTDNLPNSSTTEKYYRYLSRPDGAPTNQLGLYQVTTTLGYNGGYYYIADDQGTYVYYGADSQTNVVLHNDDSTLKNQTFGIYGGYYYYYDDYYYENPTQTSVTIQSDTPGVRRTLTATNAPLFNVWNNAQLTISSDIIISRKASEDDTGDYSSGGAIYIQSGQLNAENVLFDSSLSNYNYSNGGAITSYGYDYDYGYYRGDNIINVDGARFIGNKAYYGGAIYLYQNSILNGNKTLFEGNLANISGGAIYINNSTATLENATFTNNTVDYGSGYSYGYGGAIYAANSNLYLKGTNFTSNNAAGLGGAIYFEINDSGSYTLELGAFQGTSVEFAGNKQNYDSINYTGNANSITFNSYTSGAAGTAHVTVDVEGNSNNFNMRDPMAVNGGDIFLRFTKNGEGAWNLYGISNLSYASGVLFNIDRGTFRLGDNAELYMTGGAANQFNVRNNATLNIGVASGSENTVTLSTPHFQTDAGSTLRLDQTLNLNLHGNENVIKGTLTGTGDLNVSNVNVGDQTGTLKFSGQTSNYSGNLNILSGEFWADSGLETTGSVELSQDTILSVTANSKKTNITAKNINIGYGTAVIQVNGIIGTTEDFCILESENTIVGNFKNDLHTTLNVDYLQATFDFTADHKKYLGTVKLTWDKDNPNDDNSTFNIDPFGGQAEYFKVETELQDATANGKKLIKKGLGTLELAQANEYKGGTLIEAGTLLLTNAKGTGTGNVQVERNAILGLNFDGNYDQRISGAGQVTKVGAETTVTLTNTGNNYSGGTRLKEGILSIADGKVLGTGDLIFDGGVLQTNSLSGETALTQNMTTTAGNDVRFDTVTDLTVKQNSTISGEGGIIKTGNGKLTLNGAAGYHGTTHIQKGTLSLASMNAVGSGKIIFDDGTVFENTDILDNDRDITLNAAASNLKINPQGVIFNVQTEWNQIGSIDGDGMLVKNGTGMLTVSGENSYSGGTRIKTGILAFSETKNLGIGQIIFDGGTLRNLQAIDDFSTPMTTANGSSLLLDTPHDLTITSRLNGSGGLTKTGSGILTLADKNDYWGETQVKAGTLKVDGELTRSKVTVYSDAVLTGSGTIDNDVNFKSGAVYQWNFGIREEDSPYLYVMGAVNLAGTVFQPVTAQAAAQEHYPDMIDGWTVLRYGMLEDNAGFLSIDNELSPFYDFTLDYSTPNRIKAIGYHRRDPRPLSDSVAMGIVLAQRKVYRRTFEQIDNELQNGRYLGLRSIPLRRQNQFRGQSPASTHHVWGNFYGRTSEFESSYHTNDSWRLNSFGLQVGYSFLSTNWLSLGVTAGVEIPQLKNGRDKIDASDGFIGLYFGKRIYGLWELKGYLGGGTQNYTSSRNDTKYTYRAKYRGDSFETNFELGRPILFGTYLVRPHFGFDLEYAGQQGSTENKVSNEYRTYSNVSLTQLYFRVGIDVEKRLPLGEVFLGIDYANMIGGQSLPSVKVYYPAVKSGTTVHGTTLGQNIVSIRGGGNYHLNEAQTKSLFMNLTGDIFADRAGGQCGFTATFGYDYRF